MCSTSMRKRIPKTIKKTRTPKRAQIVFTHTIDAN
jgi:hypothetical protein